jgi:hypothetical protein
MSACVTFPGSFEVIAIPEGEFRGGASCARRGIGR